MSASVSGGHYSWAMPYAAHLGIRDLDSPLFRGMVGGCDPEDHIRFAAEVGFSGIADNLLRQRDKSDQERMGRELTRHNLRFGSFVARTVGDRNLPWHVRGAEARNIIVRDITDCASTAARVSAEVLTVVAQVASDISKEEQFDSFCGHLSAVCDIAAAQNLRIGLEPVSAVRVPDLLMRHVSEAMGLIDRIGHPALGLVFDTFHVHSMGGNVTALLQAHMDRIATVQLADSPGRFEPGSGEIDFVTVLEALRAAKVSVLVELEHYHSRPGSLGEQASLAELQKIDRVLRRNAT